MGAGPAPFPADHLPGARRRHPRHDGLCARSDAPGGAGIWTPSSNGSPSITTTRTTRMRMSCCAASRRTGPIWSSRDNIYRMESGTGHRKWQPNCWGNGQPQEAQLAKSKEVEAERFTSLDRMIERHFGRTARSTFPRPSPSGLARMIGSLVRGPAAILERMDLAHKGRGTNGHVEGDVQPGVARTGQPQRHHSTSSTASWGTRRAAWCRWRAELNRLHRSLASSSPRTARMNWGKIGSSWSVTGAGRRITAGSETAHAYRDLHVGSVAELGAGRSGGRKWPHRSVAVAKSNAVSIRRSSMRHTLRQSQARLDRTGDCLGDSRRGRPGWRSSPDSRGRACARWRHGEYSIDADPFTRFSQRGGSAHGRSGDRRAFLDRANRGARGDMAGPPGVQRSSGCAHDGTSGGSGSHANSGKNGSCETGMPQRSAGDTGAVELRPDALARTRCRGTGRRCRPAGREVRFAGDRAAPGRHGLRRIRWD